MVLVLLLEAVDAERDAILWETGEDSFRVLNATVEHEGSHHISCAL